MTEPTDFERGEAAGKIDQRLAGHDVHFSKINGSIADNAAAQEAVAEQLGDLRLAVQRLADAATAHEAVDEARREGDDYAWTWPQRIVIGLITITVIAALVIAARGGR